MMKKNSGGFSLIELMVAMGIIGIIVAVAIPTYRESIRKSNRTDAHIMLTRLTTLEEQYYFRNNQYTGDFADIVAGVTSGDPVISDDGHYSIVVTLTGGGTGWTMTATARGEQANDTPCKALTITSLGAKTAIDSLDAASTECW